MTDAIAGGAPSAAETKPIRVIFICTGNSARSQMAEAILRREGGDRFTVASAGTEPKAEVDPLAVRALAAAGIDIGDARPKGTGPFLPRTWDYVITVCDRARASCPFFPGGKESLHWGISDPAEATGTEEERYADYERALREISGRVRAFIPLAARA